MFSVIIPAYNEDAYIAKAIASVQAQTEKSLEIIVIDDGSTDGTADVVRRMAEHDPRILMLSSALNGGGAAAARNQGFDHARGRWIAILDADDMFERTRLSALRAVGETVDADIVADVLCACVGNDRFPLWHWQGTKPMSLLEFLEAERDGKFRLWPGWPVSPRPRVTQDRNPIGFVHPIFRRSFLDHHRLRYDSRLRVFEDLMFYVSCFLHGARFWTTSHALYYYLIRDGSLISSVRMADLEVLSGMWNNLFKLPEFSDHRMQAVGRSLKGDIDRWHCYLLVTRAIKTGELAGAARILFESFTNLRHFADQSLVEIPVIVAKALRGGYLSGKGQPFEGTDQCPKAHQHRREKKQAWVASFVSPISNRRRG